MITSTYEEIESAFLRNLTFETVRSPTGRSFSIKPVFDSESIKAELEEIE